MQQRALRVTKGYFMTMKIFGIMRTMRVICNCYIPYTLSSKRLNFQAKLAKIGNCVIAYLTCLVSAIVVIVMLYVLRFIRISLYVSIIFI